MRVTVKLIFVFVFAVSAVVFGVVGARTQTGETETAGRKYKNIKVLNEMPADQMGKVMNLMSASLGVDCKFCHTSNGGDFEKDDNDRKRVSREMLRMTFELNKNHFAGRAEVTCHTCHRGRPEPVAAPVLSSAAESAKQPAAKPSVERILEKYAAALGANAPRVSSRRVRAERVEPDGKTVEAEQIWQKGRKLLIRTVYPSKQYGDYVVEELFDGAAAAKFGNGSRIELKSDEIEQIKREAQIFANPDLKSVYPQMEFGAVEKIDGREVLTVIATTAEGFREKLHFDAPTGRLVRRTASAPTVLGDFRYQVDYGDFRNFGGVYLPAVTRFAVPNISWTRRLLKVENDAPIDDAVFGARK